MTNKEAAEIIRDNAVPSFPLKVDIKMWEAAKDKAVEALEKQIPKKPMPEFDEWFGEQYHCPNCKAMSVYDDEYNDKYSCCKNCGQSIKWSDDNE